MAFLTSAKRVQDVETAKKRAAGMRDAATAAQASAKANSPLEIAKQTLFGIPKAGLDVAKDIARGSVEFAVSAGEAPVRLAAAAAGRKDIVAAQLPGKKIPGLGFLGDVKSFQTKTGEKIDQGASDLEAIGGGIGETLLNEPLGVAVKPLAVVGGLALKAGGGKALADTISRIVRGGKKAAVEPAVEATVRRDAEFEGMSMAERLAATGERKLDVFGDTSLRPIPVEGQTVTRDVPFANDYREGPSIMAGGKGRKTGDLPVIRPGEPTPPGAGRGGAVSEAPGPLQQVAQGSRTPRAPVAEAPAPVSRETAPARDSKTAFGTEDPYVYHLSSAKDSSSFRETGIKPSREGYSGPGAYLANTPEATQYHNELDKGLLLRVDKEKLIEKYGRYPENKNGVQFDDDTGEIYLEGNRNIPPEFLEAKVGDKWVPVKEQPAAAVIDDAGRKESGLAKGVESAAVEKKLTEGFEGVSGYDTINIKDQTERAVKLVAQDYDRAKRIALGLEKAPEGTRDFSVYVAVEKQAQKEGDVETLRRLATMSRLNEESSGAAQTLRILAERDPDSPVAAIADIAKARQKAAATRGVKPAQVKNEVKEAKAAIQKAPKEDWGSFVDSITC